MRTKNEATFAKIGVFIGEYTDKHGISPSMAEIAEGTGIPKATVQRYLVKMRSDGVIDYAGCRSIRETKAEHASVRVPVLGRIACGIPKFAEENVEEFIRLPVSLFGAGEYFILRAYGDSMTGAGIEDGDPVLIRRQSYADEGQIVVALLDDEATLKRFYPEPKKKRVRLHPENPAMEDIYAPTCEIQGVAVKVFKDLA